MALALAIGAIGALAAPALAIEDDDAPLPTDPRVIEANSLLGEEAQRQHVIRLYGEALADDPENDTARMWLARVLSWDGQYDASLAHYERFLRRDSPPDWAAPERAAVLSWAGRYDEAEAAYQEILSRDPRNADAALGLAHVYQWSGRPRLAARAYERALELREDAGVRKELAALYGSRTNQGESSSHFFVDSDKFTLAQTTVKGEADLYFDTQILARSSYLYVGTDRDGDAEFDPLVDHDDSTQGVDAVVGLRHRFAKGVVASVMAGGRRWEGAPATALVEAEVEWTVHEGLSTGARLHYGDFLAGSQSIDAVLEGVDATTLRGWAWGSLHPMLAAYGYLETSFIGGDEQARGAETVGGEATLEASGTNNRLAWGASLDVTPWPELDVRFVLGSDFIRYRDESGIFYDPTFGYDGTVGLAGSHRFTDWLALDGEAMGGWGYSDQDGQDGDGPTYRVALGMALNVSRLWIKLHGQRSESRRSDTAYSTWGASLDMGMRF